MSLNCSIPQVSNLKLKETITDSPNSAAKRRAVDTQQPLSLSSNVMPPLGLSLSPKSFSTTLPMPNNTLPYFPTIPVDYLNYSGTHSAFKPVQICTSSNLLGGNITNVDLNLANEILSFRSSMMMPTTPLQTTAENFSIAPFNTFDPRMYPLGNQFPAANLTFGPAHFLGQDALPTIPALSSAALTENTVNNELDSVVLDYYQKAVSLSKAAKMFIAPPSRKLIDLVSNICNRTNVPIPFATPLEIVETEKSVSPVPLSDVDEEKKAFLAKINAAEAALKEKMLIDMEEMKTCMEVVNKLGKYIVEKEQESEEEQNAQTLASTSGTIQTPAIQPEQGRERPKKNSDSTSPSTSADNQIATVKATRGRGRPRKDSAPVKAPRGRGRPRKNH